MEFHKFIKRVEKLTIDNSPAILTAIGISGTLTTAYLASKASIKATLLLQDVHEKNPSTALDRKDVFKLTWKLYIPAAVTSVFTISAIVGAQHISSRRATAMAAAYSISEKAFTEYKEKVIEKVGEKKDQLFRDEIAQERVEANPPADNSVVITGNGDVLCYEHFTGRYFNSSMESLRQAENQINHQILHDGYASLTDLYYELGLKATSFTDEVGWNADHLLKLEFSTVLSQDGRPCIAIDFRVRPSRRFSSFAEG